MSHGDDPRATKPFQEGSDPDLVSVSGLPDLGSVPDPGNLVGSAEYQFNLSQSQPEAFSIGERVLPGLQGTFAESAPQPPPVSMAPSPYDLPLTLPAAQELRITDPQAISVFTGPQQPTGGAPYSPNRTPKPVHHSLMKPEHRNSKAARRGPMDEMRQLVRILVKIFPQSIQYLAITDEGGGGNRVSEEQIKDYLKMTLGEAPQPEWGVPQGWGHYLAELFSWVTEKDISPDLAMNCARRLPGRSWEAVEETLTKIGVHPWNWPLPLSKRAINEAGQRAVDGTAVVPVGQKRAGEELVHHDWRVAGDPVAVVGAQQPPHKRRRNNRNNAGAVVSFDMSYWTELDCWHIALKCLQEARTKRNSSPPELVPELTQVKTAVRSVVLQDTQSLLEVPPQQGGSMPHTMRAMQPVTLQPLILQHGGELQAQSTMLSTMGTSEMMFIVPGSMGDGGMNMNMMPVMPVTAQFQSMQGDGQGTANVTVASSGAMVMEGNGMPRTASFQHTMHPAGQNWQLQQQQQQLLQQQQPQPSAPVDAPVLDPTGRNLDAPGNNLVRPQAVRPAPPSMSADGQPKPLVGGEGSGFSPYHRLFNSTNTSSGFVRFITSQPSQGMDEMEQPLPNGKAMAGPQAGVQNLRNNLFEHLEGLAGMRGSQTASLQLLEGAMFPGLRAGRPGESQTSQAADELPGVLPLVLMDESNKDDMAAAHGSAPQPSRSLPTPSNSALNSLAAAANFADTVDDDDDCQQEYGAAEYGQDAGR